MKPVSSEPIPDPEPIVPVPVSVPIAVVDDAPRPTSSAVFLFVLMFNNLKDENDFLPLKFSSN